MFSVIILDSVFSDPEGNCIFNLVKKPFYDVHIVSYLQFYAGDSYNFVLWQKKDVNPKTTDQFQYDFLDYYASYEPLYRPMPVPTAVMTHWILKKYKKDDTPENHRWARILCQYFLPSQKNFKTDKHGNLLESLRQKYKNHIVFATRDDFNLAGDLLKKVEKKVAENKEVTFKDWEIVQRVRLDIRKYLDEEERAGRQELQETIGEAGSWSEDQIEKGKERAKDLNLLGESEVSDK